MAENTQLCNVCDLNHITKSSTHWCFECEQAFCIDCKLYHEALKLCKSHVLIPITEYCALAPAFASISTYCTDHQEKYQLFCQRHDAPLCHKCIENHSGCNNIISLSKTAHKIKISEKFTETEQSLTDIDNNILQIEERLNKNKRRLKYQELTILSEISRVRATINAHLDKIETVLINKVIYLQKKNRDDVEIMMKTLKDKKQKNISCKLYLEDMRTHASDLRTLLGLRSISSETSSTEKFLQSIIENGSLDDIRIECSIDKTIKNVQQNIKKFGTVNLVKSSSDITLLKQTREQEQSVGVGSKSINDINVNLTRIIDTKGVHVRGCNILPDGGTMIFSDYHSSRDCLIVIDVDGKHFFDLQLKPCYSRDVTCIDEKTLAVTSDKVSRSGVNIIDISCRNITEFIPNDSPCYAITTLKGSLVYCVDEGIKIKDVNSDKAAIIKLDIPHYAYIACSNDKLYYTNQANCSVTCCDMKGNAIWRFSESPLLENPLGITVDNDENVYVVNNGHYSCNSVVVLSADGKQSRTLLCDEDGLHNPVALHFDKIRNRLLVANYESSALLFDVSF